MAEEPLLLYLLAVMHREGKLAIEEFEKISARSAKIVIYQKALELVLDKQRSTQDDSTNLNPKITKLKPKDLRRILTEAALCVAQSGGELALMSMLEGRLQDDPVKKALETAKKEAGEEALKNALAAFYIRPASNQEGGIEFYHKSFSEFLFAERLKASLKAWTQYKESDEDEDEEKEPMIPIAQIDWEIYDLLGFGKLTPEIMEYLMGLLIESKNFDWETLFTRLNNFYNNWFKGKFIDSGTETLPQKKVQQLKEYNIQIGQRQVDVYVGLNVMILLFELHRYGQEQDDDELKQKIQFFPLGKPGTKNEDKFRLSSIIGYSQCLKAEDFGSVVGRFLRGANLRSANLYGTVLTGADLDGADLGGADLDGAYLDSADLTGANLRGTYLRGAYLDNADLDGADLTGANLIGTYLIGANLSSTDLTGADLTGADLDSANLTGADLTGANLNGANLNGANLRQTQIIETTKIDQKWSLVWQIVNQGAIQNLSSADLSDADLSSADLSGADLSSADLSGADLSSADLSGADLSGADLSGADLYETILISEDRGDIIWDENTKWDGVRGLENTTLPKALKQQLGLP
ncbi:pentapeptide repeat-containing protein [Scytonema sp. NUACC21]